MSITYYFTQPDLLAPQTKARSVDINNLSNAVRVGFEKIPVTSQEWSGVHDYSGGTLRARMPIAGQDVATKGYVDAQKLAGAGFPLPTVAGTFNMVADGGAVTWERSQILQNRKRIAQTLALQLALG